MAIDPLPPEAPRRFPLRRGWLAALTLVTVVVGAPALAGVQFENCVKAVDGSVTCDTVPTGNTLMNDVDARYGLLQDASPGWSEFDPYGGFGDGFAGNGT
jgi:hypothetical protein